MFGFDLNSITNCLGNFFGSGSSSVTNGFNSVCDYGSSLFGSSQNDNPQSSGSSIFGNLFGSSTPSDSMWGNMFGSSQSSYSDSFFNFSPFSSNAPGSFDMSSLNPFAAMGNMFGSGFGGFDMASMFSGFSGGGGGSASGDHADLINKISQEVGVDAKLLSAVMQQESGGRENATSECGALGLMQLMPETAESLGVNPHDPEDNLRGGAIYIKQKLEEFGGNVQLALAAYNAGSGAVNKYGGIPPYAETQNYVSKIMSNYQSA